MHGAVKHLSKLVPNLRVFRDATPVIHIDEKSDYSDQNLELKFIILVNTKYFCMALIDTDSYRNITAGKIDKRLHFVLLWNLSGSVFWETHITVAEVVEEFKLLTAHLYQSAFRAVSSGSGADSFIMSSSLAVSEQWYFERHMILLKVYFKISFFLQGVGRLYHH